MCLFCYYLVFFFINVFYPQGHNYNQTAQTLIINGLTFWIRQSSLNSFLYYVFLVNKKCEKNTCLCVRVKGSCFMFIFLFVSWFFLFVKKKTKKKHSVGEIAILFLLFPFTLRYLTHQSCSLKMHELYFLLLLKKKKKVQKIDIFDAEMTKHSGWICDPQLLNKADMIELFLQHFPGQHVSVSLCCCESTVLYKCVRVSG